MIPAFYSFHVECFSSQKTYKMEFVGYFFRAIFAKSERKTATFRVNTLRYTEFKQINVCDN